MAVNVDAQITVKAKDKASRALGSLSKTAALAFAGVAAGAVAAAVAIRSLTTSVGNYLDKIFDTTQATGLSAEALSEMAGAAELTGASFDGLTKGVQTLAKNAVTGSVEFKKWGISLKNTNGTVKTTEELLLDTADKIQSLESETLRIAAAQDLMGRSGKQLLIFLKDGREGIEKMRKRIRDLGGTVSTASAQLGDEFADQVFLTKVATEGLRREIGEQFLPLMIALEKSTQKTVVEIRKWVEANKDLIDTGIEDAINAIADAIPPVATGIGILIKLILNIKKAVEIIQIAFNKFGRSVTAMWIKILTPINKAQKALGLDGFAGITQSLIDLQTDFNSVFTGSQLDAQKSLDRTNRLLAATDKMIEVVGTRGSENVRKLIPAIKEVNEEIGKRGTGLLGPGGGAGQAPVTAGTSAAAAEAEGRFFGDTISKAASQASIASVAAAGGPVAFLFGAQLGPAVDRAREEFRRISEEQTAEKLRQEEAAALEFEKQEQRKAAAAQSFADNATGAIFDMVKGARTFGQVMIGALEAIGRKLVSAGIFAFLKMLLNFATGGAGGGFLSILGFNRGGTVPDVQRAQFGLRVPGAGGGDRVPIMATPGETVLTKGETRALETGQASIGAQQPIVINAPFQMLTAPPDRTDIQVHFERSVVPAVEDTKERRASFARRRVGAF